MTKKFIKLKKLSQAITDNKEQEPKEIKKYLAILKNKNSNLKLKSKLINLNEVKNWKRDKKGNITGDYLGSDGLPMTRANWTDDGYRKTTMQPVSGLLSHDRLMKLERDMKRQGLL